MDLSKDRFVEAIADVETIDRYIEKIGPMVMAIMCADPLTERREMNSLLNLVDLFVKSSDHYPPYIRLLAHLSLTRANVVGLKSTLQKLIDNWDEEEKGR